jgi:hypothetical protein
MILLHIGMKSAISSSSEYRFDVFIDKKSLSSSHALTLVCPVLLSVDNSFLSLFRYCEINSPSSLLISLRQRYLSSAL